MTNDQIVDALNKGEALLTALEPVMAMAGGQAGASVAMISMALVEIAQLVEPAIAAQGDSAAFRAQLASLQARNDALAAQIADS